MIFVTSFETYNFDTDHTQESVVIAFGRVKENQNAFIDLIFDNFDGLLIEVIFFLVATRSASLSISS